MQTGTVKWFNDAMRDQGAAIGVTGPDRPVEVVKSFPEAIVTKMGYVENDTQTVHLLEQFTPARSQAAGGIGSLGVSARSVMGGTDGAQAVCVGAFQVGERDDRIGSLKAENVADGENVRCGG